MNTHLDAYLAGLIDGEGSLSMCRQPRGAKAYSVRLGITMTKAESLLRGLCNEYGGRIHIHRTRSEWADGHQWCVAGLDLKGVLNRVHPFLVLKREQAEIVQEFLSLAPGCFRPWTPEALARGEELRTRLVTLNRKGPAVL